MRPAVNRERRGRPVVWGLVGQSLSSATNFALSVMAGRTLGPSGLGRILIGFAAYLIVLGLHRALLIEPLVASSSARGAGDRRLSASRALTISTSFAFTSMALVAGAGVVVGGVTGSGLLLVAPWLVPCLVQDLCRWILFRDERPVAAVTSDGAWLLVMVVTVPFAWLIGSDWAVMAAWGVGALGGTIVGLAQLSTPPSRMSAAWRWWRDEAWPFGRWVAGATALGTLLGNAMTFMVSALLGTGALGGLRAAETMFAPLTLIIPALALPGLPALARAVERGAQRRLAWRYSGLAFAGVTAYTAVMLLGGARLLTFVFGTGFTRFSDLVWPIGASQIFLAAGVGASLMLRARQRGPAILVSRVTGSGLALALGAALAHPFGVVGVAWANAAGTFTTSTIQIGTSGALRVEDAPEETVGPVASQTPSA